MIRPSRRQRVSRPPVEHAFALHLRIAARSAWSARLLRGAAAALLVSLVAAAAGASPWLQAGGLCGAFFIASLVPVRGHRARALRFIRERAGLSYETALELDAGAHGPSFADAVRARAVDSIRDVRPPDLQAWWLPLSAAALALLLFPLASRTTVFSGTSNAPAVTAQAPAGTPKEPQSRSVAAPPASAPERARAGAGGASQGAAADAPTAEGAGGPGSDQQVLSNYLQTLQQQAPAGSAPSGDAGAVTDGAPSARSAASGAPPPGATGGGSVGNAGTGAPSSGAQAAGPSSGQGSNDAAAGAGSNGAGRNGAGSSGTGNEPSQGAGGASPSAPSGSNATPSDGAAVTDPGGAQPPGGGAGAGQDLQQGAAPAPQAGAGSTSGEASGQRQAGAADGGTLPGARDAAGSGTGGNQPGSAGAAGPAAQGAAQPPQFLPGDLRPGAQSASGTLRLPGSQDVTLPPGTSMDSYRRAAEQALSEGDVPLEYQEVIRRYFR